MIEAVSRRGLLGLAAGGSAIGLLPRAAVAAGRAAATLTPLPDPVREGVLVWDVAPLGYVAEEYQLSGEADVLESVSMADAVDMSKRDAEADFARRDFRRTVVKAAQPYATRIVIYRPADPARFSGRALLEVLHPGGGGRAIVWGHSHELLASRGEAYLGVQPPLTVAGLKQAAPARYAGLHSVHPTQLWDAVIDAAALARTPGLFGPTPARSIIMAGYSYTGVATANFANFQHDRARLPDGKPLIDGYLPMASATFVRPLDVAVMRLNTQSEFNGTGGLAARSPDSDAPSGRARHYELAGAAHVTAPFASRLQAPTRTVPEAPGLPQFSPETCYRGFPKGSRPNDYPVHIVIDAMLANMFAWIERGVAPPRAPLIEVDATGATRLDADGNAIGGLRLPPVSVPIATYGVGAGRCRNFGFTAPFTEARKKALHRDHATYVAKVRQAAESLERQGFVLASGRDTLIAAADASPAF